MRIYTIIFAGPGHGEISRELVQGIVVKEVGLCVPRRGGFSG